MRTKIIIGLMVLTMCVLCVVLAHAQSATIQQNQQQQNCINQNNIAIALDNADIATKQNNIISCSAMAQSISQLNWDYFASLEAAGIRFAQFSTVTPGINWPSIITQLGISCPGSEAGVNWSNWQNCEAHGVSGNVSLGTYNSGYSAFYCGAGSIAGTC